MNSAITLNLRARFLPLIKRMAKDYHINLDDATQEAWCAIHMSLLSFDASRGTIDAWVAIGIDTKLRQLAYGHGRDPLLFAGELDENFAAEAENDTETRDVPQLAGVYGRIRALAVAGNDTKEIASALRLTRRRVEQLLADQVAIRGAALLAQAQEDNGLLLAPHLDALFDGGWISFTDDGLMLLCDALGEQARNKLGLSAWSGLAHVSDEHFGYLRYHREGVFKGK